MVRVTPVETTYKINGKKVRAEMKRIGLSQTDLAKACGHKDSTRICHIVNKGDQTISGAKLQPMIDCIIAHGGRVEGFYDE